MGTKREDKPDLRRELASLGREVQQALKAAASSKEVSALRDELAGSFRRIRGQLGAAAAEAGGSERPREIRRRLAKVADAGRETAARTAGLLREDLAAAFRDLGDRLSRLGNRIGRP